MSAVTYYTHETGAENSGEELTYRVIIESTLSRILPIATGANPVRLTLMKLS